MKKLFLLFAICIITSINIFAQTFDNNLKWEERKYAMFIHFGLYSELGGVWNGKNITQGYSEQIQSHAGIFSNWYADVAKKFNPQLWNADSIVQLAIDAGMKSIVITSKHHDGFCMYHSQYTNFNIVEATPFKRDILKELSEACARRNMPMGIYYSLIDWHFPEAYPISSHNADKITPAHHQYNKNQVRELMLNYGKISEIWFDMGWQTEEQSKELYELVHKLQPECMVSGRIGNGYGDFCVMGDNQIPETPLAALWQTPASMFNETWGYRSWQERGSTEKKTNEKTNDLVEVVAAGGNYLLNIGPKGDGSVVPFERDVLLNIGNWLKTYGNTLYATHANPFHHFFDWGNITAKDNTLYLFVKKMPNDNVISLSHINGKIKSVKILNSSKSIVYKNTNNGINIQLPANLLTDKNIEVIALTFSSPYTILPTNIISNNIFDSSNAASYNSYAGANYYKLRKTTIARKWDFETEANTITPIIHYREKDLGKKIELKIDGITHTYTLERKNGILKSIPDVGTEEVFSMELTPVQLKKQQHHTIELLRADRTIPHTDMELDNLVITLK